MRCFKVPALALAMAILALSSCSTLVTAYLINELLNDKAPKFTWRGTVTDPESRGISGLTVRIRASTTKDDNFADFEGLTNENGQYQITFKWHGHVSYRVSVLQDDTVIAERFVGTVSKGDQRDDFTVQGSASVQLSGMVRDAAGNPLQGVLVIAGTAQSRSGPALPLRSAGGAVQHVVTPESGVFTFQGSTQRFVVAAAFHPSRGFAYSVGEDSDGDGQVGLNLTMGVAGQHQLAVQVVDGSGTPVASQVLDPTRQFRLRLTTPYNLGEAFDGVVEAEGLFPLLPGPPSAMHPVAETLLVQSTGVNGVADGGLNIAGGTYQLDLLQRDSDSPATALVQGANPLPLSGPTTIVIRVN